MNANFILLQQAQADWSGIIMIVALFVVFYFFMIRPQQKRQKQIREFRDSLDKGSKVVTGGGLYGTIREVRDHYFMVDIAPNTTVRVDKGSVYPSAEDATQDAQQKEQK